MVMPHEAPLPEGVEVTITIGADGRVYFHELPPSLLPVASALNPRLPGVPPIGVCAPDPATSGGGRDAGSAAEVSRQAVFVEGNHERSAGTEEGQASEQPR